MRQRSRVRINTDKAASLMVEDISFKEPNVHECWIRYRYKKELNAVYIGDGLATAKGDALFVPVALPSNASQVQVWKIDGNSLNTTASATFTGKDVFAAPNDVGVWEDQIVAAFGDNT